jgi:hypothetical protein
VYLLVIRIFCFVCFVGISFSAAHGQKSRIPFEGVHVQITSISIERGEINWTITNKSSTIAFVYFTYLNGPAYSIRDEGNKSVFESVPTATVPGCPNDFKPATVLAIQPGGATRGVFNDSELRKHQGGSVSLAIGVGRDAQSVISEIMRMRASRECVDPAKAIIKWQTVIESNTVSMSAGSSAKSSETKN